MATYTVSNAGTNEVNGSYVENGVENGRPRYVGPNGYEMFWDSYNWVIRDASYNYFYYAYPDTATPPTGANDWDVYDGNYPAPTVTLQDANPPDAPTNLRAIKGHQRVMVAWTPPAGSGLTYTLKRAEVAGGPYTNVATGIATPYYLDTGRTNGTTYYYVVSASNAAGESANSTEVSSIPSPSSKPAGASELDGGSSLTSGQIRRYAVNEGAGTTLDDLTASNVNGALVNGPTWGTDADGALVELDGGDDYANLGTLGGAATAELLLFIRPDAVTGDRRFLMTGAASMRLSNGALEIINAAGNAWLALTPANTFVAGQVAVLRLRITGGNITAVVNGITHSTQPSTLDFSQTLFFGRRYLDQHGACFDGALKGFGAWNRLLTAAEADAVDNEPQSGIASPAPPPPPPDPPAAPANLRVTGAATSSISLAADPVAGADAYRLLMGSAAGGPYAQVAEAATPEWTASNLPASTTRYFVCRAVAGGVESANSNEVSGATATPPPTAPAAPQRPFVMTDYEGNYYVYGHPAPLPANADFLRILGKLWDAPEADWNLLRDNVLAEENYKFENLPPLMVFCFEACNAP